MTTVCQDSKCEVGGNDVCCHECQRAGGCVSLWKCDEPRFYEDCKANGGVSVEVTIVCDGEGGRVLVSDISKEDAGVSLSAPLPVSAAQG